MREDLADRDRDVAGAGWHVDEQHVEVAEVHVGQELLHCAVQHRAAPGDDRFAVAQEHPDRDGLHAVRDRRQHQIVDTGRLRAGWDAEQPGDREPVHVGVDQTYGETLCGQCHCEIRGDGRFADAALAAGDEDDACQRVGAERHLPRRPARPELLGERFALVGRHHPELDGHVGDAHDGCCGTAHVALDSVRGRASHDRQCDADLGMLVDDGDLAQHVEITDRPPQFGIGHCGDRLTHAFCEAHVRGLFRVGAAPLPAAESSSRSSSRSARSDLSSARRTSRVTA